MPNTSASSEIETLSYQNLVATIKQEITQTQLTIQQERAIGYWKIGEHIQKHTLKNKLKSGYGEKLYLKLSHDLKIDVRTLQQTVKFNQTFPIPSARSQFNWTHYREFLRIPNKKDRRLLFKKAQTKGLTTRQLQNEIKQLKDKKNLANTKLAYTQGHLYTYRLDAQPFMKAEEGYRVVDVGFGLWRKIPAEGLEGLTAGSIVNSQQDESWFNLAKSTRTKTSLYTYLAYLNYVIDGDTISLYIDAGFRTWTKQKLRLRGIDTPEINTPQGQEAKQFVINLFKNTPQITVKTYRKDKYDRYLADIFIGPNQIFLNQLLLDKKLALIY